MREEEKESLALEAAVAEGRIREEAVVLIAAMDMVVGAGVDGDSDSVRLSDIRSAIWKWNGFDSSFYSLLLFRIGFGWPNINIQYIYLFIMPNGMPYTHARTGLVWKWDWVCLLVYCCPHSLHPPHDPSISINKVGFCFYCFFIILSIITTL